jgi:DNA modification methylase
MSKQFDSKQLPLTSKRALPNMPEGYYYGDKPNPNLRAFVEAHLKERPYDPSGADYNVPAFNEPITTTKRTVIYNMHSYHQGKKPHDAIRRYVGHFTKEGDLVLDPFCGSGGTALAAMMERRRAIAIDRSPAATFITKNYCTPIDVDELQAVFEELKAKVKPEMDWLYETRCSRCGGKATTAYTLYSQTFQCHRCLSRVPLFDCAEAQTPMSKTVKACPHCYERGIVQEIGTREKRFGAVPVVVGYICEGKCKPTRNERRHNDADKRKREHFEKYDVAKLREIEAKNIPYLYPKDRMMHAPEGQECWGVKWRAGTSSFRTVDELFTKRNLWALAAYYEATKHLANSRVSDVTRFGLNAIVLAMSKMQGYVEDPRFPNQLMRGTYYVPQVSREYNVRDWLEGKLKNLVNGYSVIDQEIGGSGLIISTQSAVDLSQIQRECIDYIFTDPPYGDNVQYGELNFVWEAWLELDTCWHDEEIIVNKVRGKTLADWTSMMHQAMAECYRVLKPNRWISLCYHDTSEGTWSLVQDIMAEVGFVVDKTESALFIDTGQKSYNQQVADKVTKRDLVINFRKPKPGEQVELSFDGREDEVTFRGKALAVIRNFLLANPGATKDRIYDDLVSRMVSRGQMESFNFDAMLREIAEELVTPAKKNLFEAADPDLFGSHEIRRWYLKETADRVDEVEGRLEDKAAAKLEAFMAKQLAEHSEAEGVHYSDLFEEYLPIADKPRRPLAEWLWDYFYKTAEGTWRPPADVDEREEKRSHRETGSLRRIKGYAKLLESGAPIPPRLTPDSDRTIADWIHQARRAGLYAQGKLLFEKSGLNLSRLEEQDENLAMDVNEDYQYCLKQLSQG